MKPTVIDPKTTSRAEAYELWMNAPNPMVTFFKTLDVTPLFRLSRRRNLKFNMPLCWCIGKAASRINEFYLLPQQGKLYQYNRLAINVIVKNILGSINSCDIPYYDDIHQFAEDYHSLTDQAVNRCESTFTDDCMVIGTSAMIEAELDCIVNQYTDKFCNPMVMWGRYRKGWLRTTLPVSFQFHHVQMDGGQAAAFLNALQSTIDGIKKFAKK